MGQSGGDASVALIPSNLPAHTHVTQASSSLASVSSANKGVLARTVSPNPPYHEPRNLESMGAGALGVSGSNQPHNNLQPHLQLGFIIALLGVYPPRW